MKYINNNNEVYEEEYNIEVARHTCAHLLAMAVKRLYKDAVMTIGPSTEDGFYYDFDNIELKIEDLEKIESEMKKIVKENVKTNAEILTKEDALNRVKGNKYKEEIINELEEGTMVSFFNHKDFSDMCRGPHVLYFKKIGAFKLTSVTGAYWRGNENNKMLTRIYGTCFENKEALNNYFELLEEAKKRDHRKLGKELELFMISEYGPGFPFWLPNGTKLRKNLEDFWYKEHEKEGYEFIETPIMLNKDLWEISGHWKNYRENMYTSSIDDKDFAIKPMNCPGGMLVYKNKIYSYKDFPLKVGELGLVHRHELSGALSGLFRVRNFTQDDAHIFMTEEQIKDEVKSLLRFYDRMYKVFDLDYRVELSTRPEDKFVGDIEIWDKSEKYLEEVCLEMGIEFKLNPGDGAFYGPKLDFHIKDCLNRSWQCGTIQLDMNLPERFDLTYIEKDGSKKRPVMLHRAMYGSMERFLGILIEHYAGAFPLWLAPVQVKVLPITDNEVEYSNQIKEKLFEKGFNVVCDNEYGKIGNKIRNARNQRVPYMIILGKNELEDNVITVKGRNNLEYKDITLDEFINIMNKEIEEKL